MKIRDTLWFTELGSLHPIGIVFGEDDVTGEKKAYIGNGSGVDEYEDANNIAELGAKLTVEMASRIAAQLGAQLPPMLIDVGLLREQAREIGRLLSPPRRAHLEPEIVEAIEGVWNLLHSILDAKEKS